MSLQKLIIHSELAVDDFHWRGMWIENGNPWAGNRLPKHAKVLGAIRKSRYLDAYVLITPIAKGYESNEAKCLFGIVLLSSSHFNHSHYPSIYLIHRPLMHAQHAM